MNHDENIRKIAHLIKHLKFAMLATVTADGLLHARPMVTQEAEFDGTLWFFTGRSTRKAHELTGNQQVVVSYANPEENCWVSVSGTGHIVIDKTKMQELWKPIHRAWFPNGLDDPDLCLLRVDVERAEYWDTANSKMVQLAGFVKSVLTRKPPHEDSALVDHGEVDLGHKA